MSMKRCLDVPGPSYPGISQTVVAGPMVFLSGQVPFDFEGRLVGADDPEAQVRQCFVNVEALLKEVGAKLSDVVSLTCFMTDERVLAPYGRFKAEHFPKAPPAGTGIVVSKLLAPGAMLEVVAIAWKG